MNTAVTVCSIKMQLNILKEDQKIFGKLNKPIKYTKITLL